MTAAPGVTPDDAPKPPAHLDATESHEEMAKPEREAADCLTPPMLRR